MAEPDITWDELNDLFGDSVGKGIDLMHEETEKEIKRTRNKLAKEYKQAEKELKEKANNYLRQFEKADKEKAKLVEQGLISKKDYIEWRKNKILYHETMQNKVKSMAEYLSNVDRQAADIVRKNSFGVYAGNYNYAQYQIGKQVGAGYSFTLLNEKSVERLAHKNPKLLPNPSKKTRDKIKSGELTKWNARKINNVITQGILQGTPIPEIANALNNVTRMGWNNAVRNARTAMTGAQNAGRLDGYKALEKQGVVQEKVWIATPDERTRESHLEIDGEQVSIDKPFSNELMYPADPDGEPAEVYNCRCTMRTEVIGFRNADGSVTEIGHKRDETMHSGQMQAEKNRRETEKSQNKQLTLKDLQKPQRPKASDFDNDDELQAAREKYREKRKEYENKLDEWIENQTPNATPINDFSEWCGKKGIQIHGDISGVDGKALTAYMNRMDKLSKDFPTVMRYRENLPIEKQHMKYQFAFSKDKDFLAEASHGFTFGAEGADIKRLLKYQADDVASGFRVVGDGTINQMFDHEFGHNVYDSIKYSKENMKLPDKQRFENREKIKKDLLTNVYGKNGMSEYATTNDDELFAEAFSAWYGGEETEFAKSFGEFIERWI